MISPPTLHIASLYPLCRLRSISLLHMFPRSQDFGYCPGEGDRSVRVGRSGGGCEFFDSSNLSSTFQQTALVTPEGEHQTEYLATAEDLSTLGPLLYPLPQARLRDSAPAGGQPAPPPGDPREGQGLLRFPGHRPGGSCHLSANFEPTEFRVFIKTRICKTDCGLAYEPPKAQNGSPNVVRQ